MTEGPRATFEIETDLAPILREWSRWIESYSNEIDRSDALYWYNERANLGTLAAAAARRDSYVLEEYRTFKALASVRWTGRADLWIRCDQREYLAEAKHLWVSSEVQPESLIRSINTYLQAACADAACHPPIANCRRLGIVFVVPYLARTRHSERWEYERRFRAIVEEIPVAARAFAFPKKAAPINDQQYLYPGVACCIRECQAA